MENSHPVWVVPAGLLLKEHLAVHDVAYHVLYSVSVGLPSYPVFAEKLKLRIGQVAAGGVNRQVLQHAEGDLINAVVREVLPQRSEVRDFGLVRERRAGVHLARLEEPGGVELLQWHAP